ncbi:bifunctional murein DD-endopeptidase/murein LD-carboxypeptidase [Pantoea sp. Mhis]|uniref:bifunctional murein DD-endopeptidase/murein LD-carboxypeptidase n=1 Tax=Pantoea sp. Mhis TaxID=2576759 RepID=UPI00135C3CC3|nr:bifunctional murein DD-endopeptidase/murein LD-carboxypeptidase [Pantoea sp. Mhis]MXP56110.1 bifunctional murein DD-endopeptidase/murein LD-carboxypeptidase [Pantoea sp. Mhis]
MFVSQSIVRHIKNIAFILVLGTFLSGCSNNNYKKKNTNNKNNNNYSVSLYSYQSSFERIVHTKYIKLSIIKQYIDWKGVHYLLGGTTRNGIDCSAFVQLTFKEKFGLKIPRSTFKQKDVGKRIKRNKLYPGDLVLFKMNNNDRHIGIYLGNNHFLHVSTSNGVMISSLNNNYWKLHYRTARRLLVRKSIITFSF